MLLASLATDPFFDDSTRRDAEVLVSPGGLGQEIDYVIDDRVLRMLMFLSVSVHILLFLKVSIIKSECESIGSDLSHTSGSALTT